mmetsp:Transcript_57779/g.102557  ORF Transcript_57779/g.102557 Transcript_57779/m.102557 type:complete len:227 (-) Transcript_57779:50-730(-)
MAPGCAKCRFSDNGCAKCNPSRFTLRSRCSGKKGSAKECAAAFRSWLVKAHSMTDGSARDYAWAFQHVVLQQGATNRGSQRLRSMIKVALPKIESFVKLPQFNAISAAKLTAKQGLRSKASPADSQVAKTSPKRGFNAQLPDAVDAPSPSTTSPPAVPRRLEKSAGASELTPPSLGMPARRVALRRSSLFGRPCVGFAKKELSNEDTDLWDFVWAAVYKTNTGDTS